MDWVCIVKVALFIFFRHLLWFSLYLADMCLQSSYTYLLNWIVEIHSFQCVSLFLGRYTATSIRHKIYSLVSFSFDETTVSRVFLPHPCCCTKLRFVQFFFRSNITYHKVASSSLSCLVAHSRILRLSMKGKFDFMLCRSICIDFLLSYFKTQTSRKHKEWNKL